MEITLAETQATGITQYNPLIITGLVCGLCLALTLSIFDSYYRSYNIPFGMSDVDRYVCWLGMDLTYRTECIGYDGQAAATHDLILGVFRFWKNPIEAINWVIPLLLWIVLPASLLGLYMSMGLDLRISSYSVLFFLFGTNTNLIFGMTALYSQLISFIFFLWFLALEPKYKILSFIPAILAIKAHPVMGPIIVLYLVVSSIEKRNFKTALFIVLIACASFYIKSPFEYRFFTFNSSTPQYQPTIYITLTWYIMPLLWLFYFQSLQNNLPHKNFTILLTLIMPWVEFGRGIPQMAIYLAPYAYLGYIQYKEQIKHKTIFYLLIILLFFHYYNFITSHILKNMITEIEWRGLNPIFLKEILRIK